LERRKAKTFVAINEQQGAYFQTKVKVLLLREEAMNVSAIKFSDDLFKMINILIPQMTSMTLSEPKSFSAHYGLFQMGAKRYSKFNKIFVMTKLRF
jgi:hypothetical protein